MKPKIRPSIKVTNKFLLRGNSDCALFSHRVTVKAWDAEMGGVFPVLVLDFARGGDHWELRDAEQSLPCRHMQRLPFVMWFQIHGTRVSSLGKLCSGLHEAEEYQAVVSA